MDASRTTHRLEETINTFQKQKLKDLQVGAVCPVLEVPRAASFVPCARARVCECVCDLVPAQLSAQLIPA